MQVLNKSISHMKIDPLEQVSEGGGKGEGSWRGKSVGCTDIIWYIRYLSKHIVHVDWRGIAHIGSLPETHGLTAAQVAAWVCPLELVEAALFSMFQTVPVVSLGLGSVLKMVHFHRAIQCDDEANPESELEALVERPVGLKKGEASAIATTAKAAATTARLAVQNWRNPTHISD